MLYVKDSNHSLLLEQTLVEGAIDSLSSGWLLLVKYCHSKPEPMPPPLFESEGEGFEF